MKTIKDFKIEKNVPVITFNRGVWSRLAMQMKLTDSVVVDTENQAIALRAAIYNVGFSGKIRKLEDGKYRVWKVEKDKKPRAVSLTKL